MYKKESLELLRHKIDLVEVLSSHLDLKKSGAAFKALCPFHDEKTPSFILQRGDTHYHCFGCGAHGDAIGFLMGYLKMNFVEAIEHLAEKFQVSLEKEEKSSISEGPSKAVLKEALRQACHFYHFYLLYSEEGRSALEYLFKRGIDLEFIQLFQVGLAPKAPKIFQSYMKECQIQDQTLVDAGLMQMQEGGRKRDFFFDRITFPIKDTFGHVIGFSARKTKEETFGPKYINTPETVLFKKSHVLFGLSECRKRIAKERKVIIVEGQIDTFCLIQAGFNLTVAGQGTAFTEYHVHELIQLGIRHAYLGFDGDEAGRQAALKVGHLFQKEGIEVSFCEFPEGRDPDQFLKEKGPDAFEKLLQNGPSYLQYLIKEYSKIMNIQTPSGKTELVQTITQKIKTWKDPLMIYESLKKLGELLDIPEELIPEIRPVSQRRARSSQMSSPFLSLDPNRILETDFLRWLLLDGKKQAEFIEFAKGYVHKKHLRISICLKLYEVILQQHEQGLHTDLLSLGQALQDQDGEQCLHEILHKKINFDKAKEGLMQVIKKILEREWLTEREGIKIRIQSGQCSEEEMIQLVKQFDELKKNPPVVHLEEEVKNER